MAAIGVWPGGAAARERILDLLKDFQFFVRFAHIPEKSGTNQDGMPPGRNTPKSFADWANGCQVPHTFFSLLRV